jgi:hypothetical protein
MRRTQKLRAGKIFRKQQIPDAQFPVERSGKPGAYQIFTFLVAQEIFNARPATFLADAGVKDGNRPAVKLAANAFSAFASVSSWLCE